jgi:hypothetical protein
MPSHAASHALLGSSLFLALAIAACGGGGGGASGPQVPAPTPSASASASASTTAPVAPTAPPASGTAATPTAPPSFTGPMRVITTSAMAEDLKGLGIDPLKPPPLNKLSPDPIRNLMPTVARSPGVKCAGCHNTNDFKAATPNKRIAAKMWDDFVVGMKMDDGTPLYCDSCHGGRTEVLDRHDKKALSGAMDASYVKKLRRSDKKEHSCEQCHGDPFEPKILEAWAKTK